MFSIDSDAETPRDLNNAAETEHPVEAVKAVLDGWLELFNNKSFETLEEVEIFEQLHSTLENILMMPWHFEQCIATILSHELLTQKLPEYKDQTIIAILLKFAYPLLIHAVVHSKDNLQNINRLLQAGANPNEITDNKDTPLRLAAKNGYFAVTKRLLEAKANSDLEASFLQAVTFGHKEIASLLLEAKADITHDVKENSRAKKQAHSAYKAQCTRYEKEEWSKKLIRAFDPPQEKAGYISAAVRGGHEEIVKLLIAANADVNSADPLGKAADNGDQKMVDVLLENKATTKVEIERTMLMAKNRANIHSNQLESIKTHYKNELARIIERRINNKTYRGTTLPPYDLEFGEYYHHERHRFQKLPILHILAMNVENPEGEQELGKFIAWTIDNALNITEENKNQTAGEFVVSLLGESAGEKYSQVVWKKIYPALQKFVVNPPIDSITRIIETCKQYGSHPLHILATSANYEDMNFRTTLKNYAEKFLAAGLKLEDAKDCHSRTVQKFLTQSGAKHRWIKFSALWQQTLLALNKNTAEVHPASFESAHSKIEDESNFHPAALRLH